MIFAHHEPPTDLSTEPLLLEVYGFDFPVLPETIKLRRHLKQVLGQDYSRKSAAAWYEKHKDEFCPLKDSKLRRILASVFEVFLRLTWPTCLVFLLGSMLLWYLNRQILPDGTARPLRNCKPMQAFPDVLAGVGCEPCIVGHAQHLHAHVPLADGPGGITLRRGHACRL